MLADGQGLGIPLINQLQLWLPTQDWCKIKWVKNFSLNGLLKEAAIGNSWGLRNIKWRGGTLMPWSIPEHKIAENSIKSKHAARDAAQQHMLRLAYV